VQDQLFVVTDPPHRDVDHQTVAGILGLDVQALRLKIGFPAPEVLAATDPGPAHELADQLLDTGLNVRVFGGDRLADLPWSRVASEYAFGEAGLTMELGEGTVALSYDTPVTAVYWKPPPDFSAPVPPPAAVSVLSGADLAEALQFQAGVDLFYREGADVRRASIVRSVSDCVHPEEHRGVSPTERLELAVAEIARRFDGPVVDTRLENVRPRRRFAMGDDSFDIDLRKMFSYGTLLLRQALMAASPELGDLPQYELGSRVAYVLNRARQNEA
jgi:hypothetical protein